MFFYFIFKTLYYIPSLRYNASFLSIRISLSLSYNYAYTNTSLSLLYNTYINTQTYIFTDPFSSLLESHLVFFQMDFFPLQCFFPHSNFLTRVYIVSLTPLILVILNGFIYIFRCLTLITFHQSNKKKNHINHYHKNKENMLGYCFNCLPDINKYIYPNINDRYILSKYASQHAYFALVLSYLVLPIVSMIQFSALECVRLSSNEMFLRVDTSINCNSKEYELFVTLDIFLIIAYQRCVLLLYMFASFYMLC